MSEVLLFPGVDRVEPEAELEPVVSLVATLRELLCEAETGRLRAFAAGLVYAGDRASYVWARGYGHSAHTLVTAVSDLSFALQLDRHSSRDDRSSSPPPKEPA